MQVCRHREGDADEDSGFFVYGTRPRKVSWKFSFSLAPEGEMYSHKLYWLSWLMRIKLVPDSLLCWACI